MLLSHIVASFVLAGLSTAHPRDNFIVPSSVDATTPNPAYTSFITSTSVTATLHSQISSPAQLSKQQDDPSDDHEWDDIVATAISRVAEIPEGILSIIFDKDRKETEFATVTAPGDFGTVTVTSEAGKTTAPRWTVTNTLVTSPGSTATKTETVVRPWNTGCYYVRPDGELGVGGCPD